jgi:hypothetical protein
LGRNVAKSDTVLILKNYKITKMGGIETEADFSDIFTMITRYY